MAESFDPYHQWLGIPPKLQPANHYRLLAIEEFEDDPNVIENAADQRMQHVRTFQNGPHGEASQKLLNEITAARLCLLNPTKKAEYDRRLRDERAAEKPDRRKPVPRAVPLAPALPRVAAGDPTDTYAVIPDAAETAPLPVTALTDAAKLGRRMTFKHAVIAGIALGTLVVAAIFYKAVTGDSQDTVQKVKPGGMSAVPTERVPVEPKSTTLDASSAAEPESKLRPPRSAPKNSREVAKTTPPDSARAGEEWDGNSLRMLFCWCPAGKFTMGSPKGELERLDDGREDQVEVALSKGFWIGKFEVTQAQWHEVIGTRTQDLRDKHSPSPSLPTKGPNFPVYLVSHNDATKFCREMTERERRSGRLPSIWEYRLPTEAQWEYACRAGMKTAYSFGDEKSHLQEYAWHDSKGIREVGQKKPNRWGICDMHGNVAEWCADWYLDTLPGGNDPEVVDETTRPVRRVRRGGSWNARWSCRSAMRSGNRPTYSEADLGFRVVLVSR